MTWKGGKPASKPARTSSRRDDLDESPEAYFARVGIKAKKHSGDELRVDCPACGENEGCDVNAKTGLWSCLRASCGEKGNLWRFKSLRGDLYALDRRGDSEREPERIKSRLEADLERGPLPVPTDVEAWTIALRESPAAEEARAYLRRRGFSERTIRFASLGWTPRHPNAAAGVPGVGTGKPATKGPRRSSSPAAPSPATTSTSTDERGQNGLISIPYRGGQGEKPHLVKFRSVPPEALDDKGRPVRFTRLRGGRTTLYLPMGPPRKGLGVLLVGGELDALSVVQALFDGGHDETFDGVPFVVAGVPSGERAWNDECEKAIEEVEDVVVALDGDAAGAVASEKIIGEIGRHRSRRGRWPDDAKDANAALQSGALDVFSVFGLWNTAEAVGVAGVKRPREIEDEVVAFVYGNPPKGVPTGIRALDELTGGLRNAEITLVTGQTGAGKSTLCSQVAEYQALDARGPKRRVLVCPFELGARDQLLKLVRQHVRREPFELPEAELRSSIRALSESDRLLLFDWYGPVDEGTFRETLLYAIRRLDVGLVVLDHLHFAIPKDAKDEGLFYSRMDSFVRMLQGVFLHASAHCLLVAQPGKTGDGKHRDDHIVQLGDVRGPASLTQDLANAWSVYRPRSNDRADGSEKKSTRPEWTEAGVVVLKQRARFGREGAVELRYQSSTERFSDPRDLPVSPDSSTLPYFD